MKTIQKVKLPQNGTDTCGQMYRYGNPSPPTLIAFWLPSMHDIHVCAHEP